MKFSKYFIKRKYLIRFISTCTILLLIPYITFTYVFFYRSYNELLHNSENYYVKITHDFSNYFKQSLIDMRMHAFSIELESNKSDATMKLSLLTSNPFYYVSCLKTLSIYSELIPYPIGLYYYDVGFIFADGTKYSLEEYINLYTNKLGHEISDSLKQFFSYTNDTNIKLFSTFGQDAKSDILFVGIPTKLNTNKDKAMLFYHLDSSSIKTSLFTSVPLQFFIIDNSSSSLVYSTQTPNIIDFKNIPQNIYNNDLSTEEKHISYFEYNEVLYTIFSIDDKDNESFNFKYIALMPFNQIEVTLYNFYKTLKLIALVSGIIFIIFLFLTIYINYKPILALVRNVNKNNHLGEIESIKNTIVELTSDMNEKNLLIMDFLLNNLLYGLPIPLNEVSRLGLSSHTGKFCVFTITDITLNTNLRTSLVSSVMMGFNSSIYITDILGKNHTVIICLLSDSKENKINELSVYIKNWISDKCNQNIIIHTGIVADSINDIHLSYVSCLQKINYNTTTDDPGNDNFTVSNSTTSSYADVNEQLDCKSKNCISQQIELLKDEVLKYIKENFTDPSLSLITVSDHFGISIYSLSRLFNNYIGLGFTEFINGMRLEYAKRLLLTSEKLISEISSIVGFNSPNYFSRIFKSNIGISPRKFRDLNGNNTGI
jgi:AraC-like DNA-binding protein